MKNLIFLDLNVIYRLNKITQTKFVDSETTSESTDTFSADSIASIFAPMSDYKPSNLTSIEYMLFKYFWCMASSFPNIEIFAAMCLLFIYIQFFAMCCIVSITQEIMIYGKLEECLQFLYFMINLRTYSGEEPPSATFFMVFDFFSFMFSAIVIYGFVQIYKKSYLNAKKSSILFIVGVMFTNIFLYIEANYSADLLSKILTGTIHNLYFQAIFMIVSFIFHFVVNIFAAKTIYTSIFFFSGRYAHFSHGANLVLSQILSFVSIIWIYYLTRSIMPLKDTMITMCIMYAIFGVTILYTSLNVVGIHRFVTVSSGVLGCLLIMAAVLGVFQVIHYITSTHLIVFILAWVSVILVVVFTIMDIKRAKYFLKQLKSTNFDMYDIRNERDFLYFIQVGFSEAEDVILDGSFISWGLKKQHEHWVYFGILKFSNLLLKEPKYVKDLFKQISKTVHKTFSQKYSIYEYYMLRNVKNTGDVQPQHHLTLSELEAKIAQYQHLNKAFANKISKDTATDFLMADSLGKMKDRIKSSMKTAKFIYPNSPEVIYLYSIYKGNIRGKTAAQKRLASLAERVKNREILFANFSHNSSLNLFPKVQEKILGNRIHLASSQYDRQKSISSFNIEPTTKTYQNIQAVSIFQSRKKILLNFVNFMFFILFIMILLGYVFFFTITDKFKEKSTFITDINDNFSNVIYSASMWMYLPLLILPDNQVNLIPSTTQRVEKYNKVLGSYKICYKTANIKCQGFLKKFHWMSENMFNITASPGSKVIHEDLLIYTAHFSTLYSGIFLENSSYFPDSPAALSYENLLQSFFSSIIIAIQHTQRSGIEYLSWFTEKHSPKFFAPAIPIMIVCFMIILLPILIWREFKKLIALFPKQEMKEYSLFKAFLSRFFHPFSYYVLMNFVIASIMIIIAIIIPVCILEDYQFFFENLMSNISSLSNDNLQMVHVSNSIISLLLSRPQFENVVNRSILEDNIYESIKFFTNGTHMYEHVYYSRVTQTSYEFVLRILNQFTDHAINFSFTDTSEMINIFETTTSIQVRNNIRKVIKDVRNLLVATDSNVASIDQMLTFLLIIFYFILISNFHYIKQSIPVLIKLISYLPDNFISNSEEINRIFQESGQISQAFSRTNMLDLLNKPAVIIDRNGNIIMANRLWFDYFKSTLPETVGFPIVHFAALNDPMIVVQELNELARIVMVDEIKEEVLLNSKLQKIQSKVSEQRSIIMPKRFINNKKATSEHTGFNICASLTIIPISDEDLNPDEWISDVKDFETMIRNHCNFLKDVDILKSTGRDILLIFGANELSDPRILILEAMILVFDAMRLAIESNWRTSGMNVSAIVTTGLDADFIFHKDKSSLVDITGYAFEKQMILREKCELNSIVFCKQTETFLRRFKCGFHGDQIDDNTFIISLDSNYSNFFGYLNEFQYGVESY